MIGSSSPMPVTGYVWVWFVLVSVLGGCGLVVFVLYFPFKQKFELGLFGFGPILGLNSETHMKMGGVQV